MAEPPQVLAFAVKKTGLPIPSKISPQMAH